MHQLPWQYSTVHNSACKVFEEQTLWGQTVCRVWLPNHDAVVRVPRSALRPLNADLQPEIEAGRIAYAAAAAKVADAYMGGHDLKDDRVKSIVCICLTGKAAIDILKDIGITITTKLTTNVIKNISGKTIVAINQKVEFRLLTKFGEKGVINLGKGVPLFGGIIGATVDSVTTKIIGNIARDRFIDQAGPMDSSGSLSGEPENSPSPGREVCIADE